MGPHLVYWSDDSKGPRDTEFTGGRGFRAAGLALHPPGHTVPLNPDSRHALPPVLWALLFGNFVVGYGVSAVPSTLPDISTSLEVSVAQAGQLISASSLVVALGAPMVAAMVGEWDRRRLLTLAMCWYGLLHLLCAFMPSLGSLMVVRMLAMVSPALFTPQAAACAGLLAPVELRGRAITFVFLGFSASSVFGMPLSAYVSGTLGWRYAFALVGLCSLANALWIWLSMPDGVKPPSMARQAWGRIFRSPAIMSCLAVTLMFGSGQFIVYSYFAPHFKDQVGLSTLQVSLLFMWLGTFGLLGNTILSRKVDRVGAPRSLLIALGLGAVTMLLWPLGVGFFSMALVLVPWALGYFAANSSQQVRLAGIAPTLTTGSIALNTAAIYAGQGVGAAVGGVIIASGHWDALHWASLAGLLLAMLASMGALRLARTPSA